MPPLRARARRRRARRPPPPPPTPSPPTPSPPTPPTPPTPQRYTTHGYNQPSSLLYTVEAIRGNQAQGKGMTTAYIKHANCNHCVGSAALPNRHKPPMPPLLTGASAPHHKQHAHGMGATSKIEHQRLQHNAPTHPHTHSHTPPSIASPPSPANTHRNTTAPTLHCPSLLPHAADERQH